jgi:hypothetical protein
MNTPDLVKLAPELSAEERYKIMTADWMARTNGKPQIMTESERRAMVRFPTTAMWREYGTSVITFKLVNTIWVNEIQIDKLRTFACYLMAMHEFEKIVVDCEDYSEDKRAEQFESLKKYVATYNEAITDFRAYKEAIPLLEQELCGIPFFSKPTSEFFAQAFKMVEDATAMYNGVVREFCGDKEVRKFIKPIVNDMDSYLVSEAAPNPSRAATLVEQIKELAESEMKSRE